MNKDQNLLISTMAEGYNTLQVTVKPSNRSMITKETASIGFKPNACLKLNESIAISRTTTPIFMSIRVT